MSKIKKKKACSISTKKHLILIRYILLLHIEFINYIARS